MVLSAKVIRHPLQPEVYAATADPRPAVATGTIIMSDEDGNTVVGTAFELQRDTLKLGQRAIEQTAETRQNLNDLVLGGLETQEEAQKRTLEFSREAIEGLLDAVEGNVDGSEGTVRDIRDAVGDGFDDVIDRQGELFDSLAERYDPDAEAVGPLSEELLDALEEQLRFPIDANGELDIEAVRDSLDDVEIDDG